MPTRTSMLTSAASVAAAAITAGTALEVSVWLVDAPGAERCSGLYALDLGGGTAEWRESTHDLVVTGSIVIPAHEDAGRPYVAIGVATRIDGVDLVTPIEDLVVGEDATVTVEGIHWILA